MSWQAVVLKPGQGEKLLFKIGLMTFKVSSETTENHFVIIETDMAPGAKVPPHQHPEAEVFYILNGEFVFYVDDMETPIACKPGSFISVPPHVRHGFEHQGSTAGKILGMMMPGGPHGLEGFFRQMGVRIERDGQIPDVNQPVEHILETISRLKTTPEIE